MVLRIFGDLLSQPSRAVLIFARANNIDHVWENLQIRNRDLKKPEFLAINPMGKVPAIDDDGFKLFESHAILRYLATSRSAADHWYPTDARRRAAIDCILDWHHANLREGSRTFIFGKVLAKGLGLTVDGQKIKESESLLLVSLKFIEDIWLNEDGPFLCGSREISVADLSLVCEIKQLLLLDQSGREEILGPREKLRKWVQAVEENLAPQFNEVHSLIIEVSRKIQVKHDAAQKKSSL